MTAAMRTKYLLSLAFLLVFGCSDGQHSEDPGQQAAQLPFLDYVGAPQPVGGICTEAIDTKAQLIVSGFGFNTHNTRNQPSLLEARNVRDLELKFRLAAAGATEKRGAPAVTAQAIFLTSGNELQAVNRLTGCQYWSYTTTAGGGQFRSASILYVPEVAIGADSPATVFAADFNGYVYALNAKSGELLWQTFVGTDEFFHFVTGGMQYHQGKLFVPVSSKEVLAALFVPGPCCSSHGMLVALDAASGESLWEYHTTAEATEVILPGSRIGPNGATVWATPTLDVARNAIYIGTAQNYTEPITNTSDAIISLDMDTGVVNWIFQARSNDAWNGNCGVPNSLRCADPEGFDFDFGAAPILVRDSTIIAGDKGGVIYSLQADTGALNWSTKIGRGSTLGGIHWGMAVDEQRVYAAATDFSIDKATGGLSELVEGATPGIYALNLDNGAIDWEIHPMHVHEGLGTHSLFSASLSVSNDLLFGGSLDGVVRAFRTEDGEELWAFDTAI